MVSSFPEREGLCSGNSLPHHTELLTGSILHKSGPFSHSFCEYICVRMCHARYMCKDMLWLEMCAKVCHAWKYVWEHVRTGNVCKDVPWLKICIRTCCGWRCLQRCAMPGDVCENIPWQRCVQGCVMSEMCTRMCHAWRCMWEHAMTEMCTRMCYDWDVYKDVSWLRCVQGRAVTREDFHSSRLLPPALPVSLLFLRMTPQSCGEE